MPAKRLAQIVHLRPEAVEAYKECHAKVWPEVLQQIHDCNIRDYSIFLDDKTWTLFATMKYVGDDYAKDMQAMKANPKVQEWWRMTDGMQDSPNPGATGSMGDVPWWRELEEVFYTE